MEQWEFLKPHYSSLVGDYCLKQIKSKGIKLKDVSKSIGINNATLGNKLHGKTNFRKIEVERVCEYLNINPSIIFPALYTTEDITCYEEQKQNFTEVSLNKEIEDRIPQLTLKLFDLANELIDNDNKDLYDIKALSGLVDSICNLLYGGNNNGKNSNN